MQFCQSLFIILYVFSTIIEIKKNAGELLEPARKHKQKKEGSAADNNTAMPPIISG